MTFPMISSERKALKKVIQFLAVILVIWAGYAVYVNLRWAHTNGQISKLRHDIRTLSNGVRSYYEVYHTLPETIDELKKENVLDVSRGQPDTSNISLSKKSANAIKIIYTGPPLYGVSQTQISDFVSEQIEVNELGKIELSFPDYTRSHSSK